MSFLQKYHLQDSKWDSDEEVIDPEKPCKDEEEPEVEVIPSHLSKKDAHNESLEVGSRLQGSCSL